MRASAGSALSALSSACNSHSTCHALLEQLGLRASTSLSQAISVPGGLTSCRGSHKSCRHADEDVEQDAFRTPGSRNVQHVLLDPVSMLTGGRGLPLGFACGVSEPGNSKLRDELKFQSWLDKHPTYGFGSSYSTAEGRRLCDTDIRHDRVVGPASAACSQEIIAEWSCAGSNSTDTAGPSSSFASGEAGSAAGGGENNRDEEDDDAEDLRRFSEDNDELKSIQKLREDLKALDEVFEALAEVPWLDESVLSEREQKGMLAVAMLGTLEEAGWKVRQGVHSIWSGQRDIEIISQGAPPREQAALLSVLFHTRNIEQKYGPPPAPWKPATDFFRLFEGETVPDQESTKGK